MKKSLLPRNFGKQINNLLLSNKEKYIIREIVRRVNRHIIENKYPIKIFFDEWHIIVEWNKGTEFSDLSIRIDIKQNMNFAISGRLDHPDIWEQIDIIKQIICIKNGPHLKLSL